MIPTQVSAEAMDDLPIRTRRRRNRRLSTNRSQPRRRTARTQLANRALSPASTTAVNKQRYHTETCRPIVCLAFVIPLIVIYEIGSIMVGHPALRSGIDQWFNQFLTSFGFGHVVVLPIVTTGILIGWHHYRNDHWKIRPSTLSGMAFESIGVGLILYCAANAFHEFAVISDSNMSLLIPFVESQIRFPAMMAAIGSGIYEELFFRLILLLPMVALLNQWLGHRRLADLLGILVISWIFAALHYSFFNPAGAPFDLTTFGFRFLASIVFCILFLFRGFGIAVGAHASFDVLAQI